jgi:hypothetical protein
MPPDARSFLPLKPLVFQVLLTLSAGERHGWSLVREIQQAGAGARVLPANFYRTLRSMLADGLIEETEARRAAEEDDERQAGTADAAWQRGRPPRGAAVAGACRRHAHEAPLIPATTLSAARPAP